MKLLPILLLLTVNSFGQTKFKWLSLSKNDVGLIVLQSISGSADGLNQKIIHHRFGLGNKFWDNRLSWKNKYKDWDNGDKSAAFMGSKTWLVMFTDGFHLTRFIDKTAMIGSIGISSYDLSKYSKKDRWKVVVKKMVVSVIANKLFFNVVYKNA